MPKVTVNDLDIYYKRPGSVVGTRSLSCDPQIPPIHETRTLTDIRH